MTSVQSFDESLQADPARRIPAAADGSRGLTVIYSLTIFLDAFLLFQVQPLIGKFILPWFGGSPACGPPACCFFRCSCSAATRIGHLTTSHLRPRWQAIVHVVLLAAACVALPIIPGDTFKPTGGEEPISRIILVLGATVGAPFFVLSSTGPLLQGWFSRTHHSRSPYRLYATLQRGIVVGADHVSHAVRVAVAGEVSGLDVVDRLHRVCRSVRILRVGRGRPRSRSARGSP